MLFFQCIYCHRNSVVFLVSVTIEPRRFLLSAHYHKLFDNCRYPVTDSKDFQILTNFGFLHYTEELLQDGTNVDDIKMNCLKTTEK